MITTDVAPVITTKYAVATILFVAGFIVYLHAATQTFIHGLHGEDIIRGFQAFLQDGRTLASDAGWIIPMALGTVLAGYAAIFGQLVLAKETTIRVTRDTIVLVSLGTAALTAAFATTVSLGLAADPRTLTRAFPIAGFTALTVVLSAKTGTFFWGNPSAQLRQAHRDLAETKARQQLLAPMRAPAWGHAVAWPAWVIAPSALLALAINHDTYIPADMWAPVCGFIVFSIIVLVGSAMHVVHYLAVIPSTRHRIVGIPAILACVIGCAGFPGLVLWTLTGAATHITSVAIILAVIFSTAYPSAAPFTIRFLARSLAYRSLRRNQRAAARIAKSARGRLA